MAQRLVINQNLMRQVALAVHTPVLTGAAVPENVALHARLLQAAVVLPTLA